MRAYRVVTIQTVRREYVVHAESPADAGLSILTESVPEAPASVTVSAQALQHVLAEPSPRERDQP